MTSSRKPEVHNISIVVRGGQSHGHRYCAEKISRSLDISICNVNHCLKIDRLLPTEEFPLVGNHCSRMTSNFRKNGDLPLLYGGRKRRRSNRSVYWIAVASMLPERKRSMRPHGDDAVGRNHCRRVVEQTTVERPSLAYSRLVNAICPGMYTLASAHQL